MGPPHSPRSQSVARPRSFGGNSPPCSRARPRPLPLLAPCRAMVRWLMAHPKAGACPMANRCHHGRCPVLCLVPSGPCAVDSRTPWPFREEGGPSRPLCRQRSPCAPSVLSLCLPTVTHPACQGQGCSKTRIHCATPDDGTWPKAARHTKRVPSPRLDALDQGP